MRYYRNFVLPTYVHIIHRKTFYRKRLNYRIKVYSRKNSENTWSTVIKLILYFCYIATFHNFVACATHFKLPLIKHKVASQIILISDFSNYKNIAVEIDKSSFKCMLAFVYPNQRFCHLPL